jgi:hypothetical protein
MFGEKSGEGSGAARVYLKEDQPGGGGAHDPWCRSCKEPIRQGQKMVRIHFASDPNGAREMTGPYHAACSKPFDSMAQAINMMSRFGR